MNITKRKFVWLDNLPSTNEKCADHSFANRIVTFMLRICKSNRTFMIFMVKTLTFVHLEICTFISCP